jgi:hypothetical protein
LTSPGDVTVQKGQKFLLWMIISLVLTSVFAVQLLEAQYRSETCTTFPHAVYHFSVSNVDATKKGNETWPQIYEAVLKENGYPVYPYYTCGNAMVGFDGHCCYSSLDTSNDYSRGIQSGMEIPLPSTANAGSPDFLSYFPTNANAQFYCQISNDRGGQFGYLNAWYLQDGVCSPTLIKTTVSVRCHSNGLQLFNTSDCSGTSETFLVSGTPSIAVSTLVGSLSVRVVNVGGGMQKVGWTAFEPYWLLVPVLRIGQEIVAVLAFSLALLSALVSLAWAVKKVMIRKENKSLWFLCFSQMVWVCWILVRIRYIYTVFITNDSFYQTKVPMMILQNITTVCTAIYSTLFFNTVLQNDVTPTAKLVPTILLPIFHLLLAGSQYVNIYQLFPYANSPLIRFIKKQWEPLLPYWIMVMFIWNLLPLTGFLWKVVSVFGTTSFVGLFGKVYHTDWKIIALIALQISTIISYYICISLRTYTAVFGSDRVFLSLYAWEAMFLTFHAVINCFLTDRVVNMLKNTTKSLSLKVSGVTGSSVGGTSTLKADQKMVQ